MVYEKCIKITIIYTRTVLLVSAFSLEPLLPYLPEYKLRFGAQNLLKFTGAAYALKHHFADYMSHLVIFMNVLGVISENPRGLGAKIDH